MCSHGTPVTGTHCLVDGGEYCYSCNPGYGHSESAPNTCTSNVCHCEDGIPATAGPCTTSAAGLSDKSCCAISGEKKCARCPAGYEPDDDDPLGSCEKSGLTVGDDVGIGVGAFFVFALLLLGGAYAYHDYKYKKSYARRVLEQDPNVDTGFDDNFLLGAYEYNGYEHDKHKHRKISSNS